METRNTGGHRSSTFKVHGRYTADTTNVRTLYGPWIACSDVVYSFSALKMDGKPLYEYARNGIPLPRPIEARPVTVHSLKIEEWLGNSHEFKWPEKSLGDDEKKALEKALSVGTDVVIKDTPETEAAGQPPTAFVLSMTVSGGTYVRSVIHDLAHAVGSAGHVVTLTRSRQGRFMSGGGEKEDDRKCIPWSLFEKALEKKKADADVAAETDEDGLCDWEREVLEHIEIIE